MAECKEVKSIAKEGNDLYRAIPTNKNKRLRLTLPLGVSVNHMYTRQRNLTSKARTYMNKLLALIQMEVEEQRWNKQSDGVWYYVDFLFYMPDRRIRDTHNFLKLVMDAIEPCIKVNDYYLLTRIQGAEYDAERPRIEAIISPQSKLDRERALAMFK